MTILIFFILLIIDDNMYCLFLYNGNNIFIKYLYNVLVALLYIHFLSLCYDIFVRTTTARRCDL
ncbi:hypothetical protein ACJX0J_011674, partial [Zea mays]